MCLQTMFIYTPLIDVHLYGMRTIASVKAAIVFNASLIRYYNTLRVECIVIMTLAVLNASL